MYYSQAYSRTPHGNHWVKTANRWELYGASAVPADMYIRQTQQERDSLEYVPTGVAEGEQEDRFFQVLLAEVKYFAVAEDYRSDGQPAVPILFAVGDAHIGKRMPSPPICTGMWECIPNSCHKVAYGFPLSIIQGRLCQYTVPCQPVAPGPDAVAPTQTIRCGCVLQQVYIAVLSMSAPSLTH